MLKALLIILHVVVCLILVLVVLLQTGKRADLAGAFGGAASAITGGKFANSFVSSAFAHLFNQEGLGELTKKQLSVCIVEIEVTILTRLH